MKAIATRQSYTNTASGNLNKKQQQEHKFKQIDIDDLDVDMISPTFLSTKTLKKPFKQLPINLALTNPQGIALSNSSYSHHPQTAVIFKPSPEKQKKIQNLITVIDASNFNIKPAYKTPAEPKQIHVSEYSEEKDNYTMMAALIRKGQKLEMAIKVVEPTNEKKVGPAESKLKSLFNKKEVKEQNRKKQSKDNDEIGEEIIESLDEYGNESFEKLSGAYESAIRESIIGESNVIKESIKESIRESMAASSSKIKESIREDVNSMKSLREEIAEEISGSIKKSKESIEEVYEEIFEDEDLSGSLGKSQNKFKKSGGYKDSDSASKSFRLKTNVIKSIRIADEFNNSKIEETNSKILIVDKQNVKGSHELDKEKERIKKIQENVASLLAKAKPTAIGDNKNKDLLYRFKLELSKLLTSEHFESKLRRLTSFIRVGEDSLPNSNYINDLQDKILKNVLFEIDSMKKSKGQLQQMQKLRQEYEQKLQQQLKIQEINLRAQMNQKISEKDFELKKMIAQLQSRMQSMPRSGRQSSFAPMPQHFEVESDYSIDSDNVSWKADLWELLPEYEKKKLYERQTNQVTKFLTQIMVNEIKDEALDRSVEISFQFPDDVSGGYENWQREKSLHAEQNISTSKNSFQKKQSGLSKPEKTDFLADLPKLPIMKQNQSNQYAKQMVEERVEKIRRDEKLKPEVIKILSEYKNLYIKKKADIVKKTIAILTSRDKKVQTNLLQSLLQVQILSEKEYKKDHAMYIKAYEEELVYGLLGIFNRCNNKKQNAIEEEMKKNYERLVVTCQVSVGEACVEKVGLGDGQFGAFSRERLKVLENTPCAIEIGVNSNYLQLKEKRETKQIQKDMVEQIVQILTLQFAREFPKKKK